MRFRPCIDLHDGVVKQIVGGTLVGDSSNSSSSSDAAAQPVTNFVSSHGAAHYARLYARDGLRGGHVIMLGGGNEAPALDALRAFPGGLQVGGGVTAANAHAYLDAGASHVIVTSYVFRNGTVDYARLRELVSAVGRERLVLDLSCRKRLRRAAAAAAAVAPLSPLAASDAAAVAPGAHAAACAATVAAPPSPPQQQQLDCARTAESTPQPPEFEYVVVTDRWQRWTDCVVDAASLAALAEFASEFLVHGVDVEGLRAGIEDELVALLGAHSPIPVTYAGGVRDMADLQRVRALGGGRVDVTIGSALDIFGGSLSYTEVVAACAEGGAPAPAAVAAPLTAQSS